MIIDFRMRPPARGFLNIGVYDDVARTAKLTECFSMKQAPSVAQKSPELMLQEMDTAGVTTVSYTHLTLPTTPYV